MKAYCDSLQAGIGGVGFVLKDIEYLRIHSDFQNHARLAIAGFRSISDDFHE